MRRIRISEKQRTLWILLLLSGMSLFCGIISIIIFLDQGRPDAFKMYFLFPASYFIMVAVMLSCHRYLLRWASVLFIFFLYFIKYCIVPFFTFLGNYNTYLANESCWKHMDRAVFLSVYEIIAVSAVLFYMMRKKEIKKYSVQTDMRHHFCPVDLFDCIVILSVFICVLLLMNYPSLGQNFHFAWDIQSAKDPVIELRSWRTIGSGSKVPLGIFNTLLMDLFYNIQIFLPLLIIEKITERGDNKSRKRAFFESLCVCAGTLIVLTEANVTTILVVLSLGFLVFKLYPETSKKALPITVIGFGLVVFILFMQKIIGSSSAGDTENLFGFISKSLNAYLGGPVNLSAVFEMKDRYHPWIFLTETLAQFPGFSRFFTSYESSKLFNEVFWNVANRTDQLLPSVGQGMLYFGVVLAPAIPVFFVWLSVKCERLAERRTNIKEKGILYFGMVICAMLIGNNFSHFLTYLNQYIIFIFLLQLRKKRIRGKMF